MNNSLLTILKDEFKLDFTKTLIHRLGGATFDNDFELSPRDFLRYAKSDLNDDSDKGLINSLTNSKRAIDCQIDCAFTCYGLQYDRLDDVASKLINTRTDIDLKLPFKLKLITALDFAPSGLVSKARKLRNKLEHYYKRPNNQEVRDSIELAELFILAVDSKTKIIEEGFVLTDKQNFQGNEADIGNFKKYNQFLLVELNGGQMKLSKRGAAENKLIESINQNSAEFYFLIRIMNNLQDVIDCQYAFKDLLKYLAHPIPEKQINLDIGY